jgi:hypothetical protein
MIEELRNYLHPDFNFVQAYHKTNQGFTEWLLQSNNPKVGPYLGEDRHKDMLVQVERESLQEILDILLREPLADYFWYTYRENGRLVSDGIFPDNGGALTYALPHHDVVPSGALRVDKEKMKIFLRDIKIESILQ